ncbi:hypothetical protein FX016_10820 [Cupriavidus gilardii]|nr:hypothetical protein FX016_10820 [Cupriavidus gilardii]
MGPRSPEAPKPRSPEAPKSRGLEVSGSRGLGVSRSRGLGVSGSRGLGVSGSRGCGFSAAWRRASRGRGTARARGARPHLPHNPVLSRCDKTAYDMGSGAPYTGPCPCAPPFERHAAGGP